eukprot:8020551-Pyramimonas_sp.AAC.1
MARSLNSSSLPLLGPSTVGAPLGPDWAPLGPSWSPLGQSSLPEANLQTSWGGLRGRSREASERSWS